MQNIEVLIWTLLRLIVPLSIFLWPFGGAFTSSLIDLHDFKLVNKNLLESYEFWDKPLDIYYYSIAAFVVLFWKEKRARQLALGFYLYRLIGTILFVTTKKEELLLIFPNLFENFFLFYTAFIKVTDAKRLFTTRKNTIYILSIIGITKLVQEYFLHVANTDPRKIASLFPALINTPKETMEILVYVLPILIIFVWIVKRRLTVRERFLYKH